MVKWNIRIIIERSIIIFYFLLGTKEKCEWKVTRYKERALDSFSLSNAESEEEITKEKTKHKKPHQKSNLLMNEGEW